VGVDASLGRANVAIRATLDQLDGDLAGARGKVDSAVSRIVSGAGKNFQALGTAALGGIGVATGAITGLGAALGKITVDAAPVEGLSQAFDGLAESSGRGADEMLAALKKGSAGMVSNRDLMLSFNQAAGLVSTDFAVQLPEAMGYLGKVAASTGQDMGFMLDSLVKGVGRVSPMILDNLGIQVAQAEATERAAEMFGVEADALDKGQIQAGMMNVVLEKLAANTASMPDITETAAAKMARFKATMQDAKDEAGLALLPALNNLMGAGSKLAEVVLPPLADFLENTLAPAVVAVTGVVNDFFWLLGTGDTPLEALRGALEMAFGEGVTSRIFDVVNTIAEFGQRLSEYLAPVMEWISENVELQDVLIALGAAIAAVVLPALWSVITAAAPVIAVFIAAVAIVAALRAAWESDFLGLRTFVLDTLEKITAWWAEHGDAIMAKAREIWETALEVFSWFGAQFAGIFQAFKLAFEGDWRGFGEKLRQVWDEIWAKIRAIGEIAWDAIRNFFNNTDWGAVGRGILEGVARGITRGTDIIRDAARDAARAALEAAMGFLGIGSPSREAMEQIGLPFIQGIGAGMEYALPSLVATAEDTSARMLAATSTEAVDVGTAGGGAGYQINNYFGADSVRSEEDIYRLTEEIDRTLSLRGLQKVVA